MKNKKIITTIIAAELLACWLVGQNALASSLYFKTDNNSPTENLSILNINTGNESINTVSGKIIFDSNNFDCEATAGSNSIINIWLTQPRAKNGEITLAGIIPGGFIGQGELASIVCKNKNNQIANNPNLSINKGDFEIFLNDGTGNLSNITIGENQEIGSVQHQNITDAKANDKIAPEILNLEISKNNELSDNKYLLMFNISDKQSGISSVAISASNKNLNTETEKETIISSLAWTEIESPYVLPNDFINRYVYLKISDQAGNIKLSKLSPLKPWWKLNSISISLIVIILLVAIALIVLKLKRRNKV